LKLHLITLYRFMIGFGIGYLCTYFFALNLIHLCQSFLPKAESVLLGSLVALIFYIAFVILIFCIKNLKWLSLLSLIVLSILFLTHKFLG